MKKLLFFIVLFFFAGFAGNAFASATIIPSQSTVILEDKAVQSISVSAPVRKVKPTKAPLPTPTPYVETEKDKQKLFKVVSVIDGKTIRVSIRGKIEIVRLLDTKKTDLCSKLYAANKMKALVTGKYVKLLDEKTMGNRDKAKRLVRYVYLENGDYVNDLIGDACVPPTKQPTPSKSLVKPTVKPTAKIILKPSLKPSATPTKAPVKVLKAPTAMPTEQPTTKQLQVAAPIKSYSGGDKDCPDFATHAEAQAFFISQGGPANDPHRLDADKDGLACETLP